MRPTVDGDVRRPSRRSKTVSFARPQRGYCSRTRRTAATSAGAHSGVRTWCGRRDRSRSELGPSDHRGATDLERPRRERQVAGRLPQMQGAQPITGFRRQIQWQTFRHMLEVPLQSKDPHRQGLLSEPLLPQRCLTCV